MGHLDSSRGIAHVDSHEFRIHDYVDHQHVVAGLVGDVGPRGLAVESNSFRETAPSNAVIRCLSGFVLIAAVEICPQTEPLTQGVRGTKCPCRR